ncbi:MAG: hypothetical protein K2X66_16545 [Cyanobacteria bacterium]|nr:hypothetical protein [Cyanobacteriota bacterium]
MAGITGNKPVYPGVNFLPNFGSTSKPPISETTTNQGFPLTAGGYLQRSIGRSDSPLLQNSFGNASFDRVM